MNTLGNKIKLLRLTKGLSQMELASKTGTSAGIISHWETGHPPRAKAIPILARVLGCEASELAQLWMQDFLSNSEVKK